MRTTRSGGVCIAEVGESLNCQIVTAVEGKRCRWVYRSRRGEMLCNVFHLLRLNFIPGDVQNFVEGQGNVSTGPSSRIAGCPQMGPLHEPGSAGILAGVLSLWGYRLQG